MPTICGIAACRAAVRHGPTRLPACPSFRPPPELPPPPANPPPPAITVKPPMLALPFGEKPFEDGFVALFPAASDLDPHFPFLGTITMSTPLSLRFTPRIVDHPSGQKRHIGCTRRIQECEGARCVYFAAICAAETRLLACSNSARCDLEPLSVDLSRAA